MVARGYEEENKDSLRTTISKDNLQLLYAIITTHHLKICDLEIKVTFLQGSPVTQDVYLMYPNEAGRNKLCKLKTTVKGLGDAARSWYITVKEELLKTGAEMSEFYETLFISRNEGKLHALIVCHIDDYYGSSVLFNQQIIDKIKEKFDMVKKMTACLNTLDKR